MLCLSGYEVCCKFKDDQVMFNILILMVIVLSEIGDIECVVEVGCDDFF